MREQRPFLARIENPIQLKSCLGNKSVNNGSHFVFFWVRDCHHGGLPVRYLELNQKYNPPAEKKFIFKFRQCSQRAATGHLE